MENINNRVTKLVYKAISEPVHEIVDIIVKETNICIDIDKVNEIINKYNEKQQPRRCKAITIKGKSCYADAIKDHEYCKRHLGYNQTYCETITQQCKACTKNGNKCSRNALKNGIYCGHHVHFTESRTNKCLYGMIEDEDISEEDGYIWINTKQCKHNCESDDTWFCKKHEKYQELATQQYNYKSLTEYMNNEKEENFVMVDHIENLKVILNIV